MPRPRGRPASFLGAAEESLRRVLVCFIGLLLATSPFLLAQTASAPTPESTIKVQVKQVLVPVVVTDKRGHYVTDLKARDFEVAEDGVEQRIVDFRTSESGAEQLFQPVTLNSSQPAATSNSNKALRRTYLICLDTMNTSFTDFADVRNALLKLFKSSSIEDAAYGLLAIGRQTMIVQNLTKSPPDMLTMLGSKQFLKTIQSSESSNLARQEFDLTAMLNEYCEKCPCAGEASITTLTSGGSDQVCTAKWGSIEMWAGSRRKSAACWSAVSSASFGVWFTNSPCYPASALSSWSLMDSTCVRAAICSP